MTIRWGMCNTKTGKLWFNLQIAKKSLECLEYIFLYEILYLIEKTQKAAIYVTANGLKPELIDNKIESHPEKDIIFENK